MGNAHVKPHPRTRNKKQVHWKAAARPLPPGKPQLISEADATPDLVTIRWTKPVSDGGSPISGYLVEHRRTGSPHWVRASPLLVQVPEVTISGLEPGWRYQFRVRAENAVGMSDASELSEPITVTLQRSAITAPRFTQELQDTVALENEKAEFVAHFLGQPAPKVCWYKDGFEIFSSRRIRILTETDRSVLTIHQCSLSDEGEIKCTATNRAGHVSSKAGLMVEAPPSIRLPRQYEEGLLFEIGETIRLKVSIAGRPTPLVFWSHNGESIKNNDRYEIEYVDRSSILKINEAQRTDRGEYHVKAVNKLGENTQSFLVTVTDKPSPPGKARVVMALGRSVTLSWTMPQDDGGCKIGNYIVEYYRLGWNVWLKAVTSRQLSTILGDLIEGSEYKFRVKAESPYGVSDPSEETEVIFIPDPKRGILQPQPRGRSQPRDMEEVNAKPPEVATRRKKPRSQSSSRAEEYIPSNIQPNIQNAVPVRPERTKIKSPPKTPEMSPMATRKETSLQINKNILEPSERSSIARDLAYGSPEIKVKKDQDLSPKYTNHNNYFSSGSEKSASPSPLPAQDKNANHKVYSVKIEKQRSPSPAKPGRSPSPEIQRTRSPRENNENFTGSSEFMLVLYPDENERDHSDFEFEENSVPPPMSLSAPELGSEPPLINSLRTSASSTELLHERAMMRFYEAAEAEEAELQKRRKSNKNDDQILAIPKIQINSKDEQDIVGLERQSSFRRRKSAGAFTHQQALSVQRRHSLRSSSELKGDILQKLHKFTISSDSRREAMMHRQRSESEEREDEAFEEVRQRMMRERQLGGQRKRGISVVDEERWADDYESSTEEESELSEEERPPGATFSRKIPYEEEEENDTYHPGILQTEPFEILTKRKDPPDPNFIPKPILKKKEHEEHFEENPPIALPLPLPPPQSKPKPRSSSPRPQNYAQRERSQSLIDEAIDIQYVKDKFQPKPPEQVRPRSFSLVPQEELATKQIDALENLVLPNKAGSVAPGHTISAVAHISGITAASIVIPDKLLEKQKDTEEAKVVIDHYGDILRKFGKRKKSNPQIYLDRDSLKKVAENIDTPQTDLEDYQREPPKENQEKQNINENSQIKSSFTDHYNTKPSKSNSLITKADYSEEPTETSIYHDSNYPRRSSFTDHNDNTPRRDNLNGNQERDLRKQHISPQRKSNFTDHYDSTPRRDSLNTNQERDLREQNISPQRKSSFTDHYDSTQRRDSLKTNQEYNRKQNISPQRKRERTLSKSPPKQIVNREPSPRRSPARSKPMMSPVRQENWSTFSSNTEKPVHRKTSPSPLRTGKGRKTSPSPLRRERPRKTAPSPLRKEMSTLTTRSKSPSPVLPGARRPMLREIMTQTSVGLETYDSDSRSGNSSPTGRSLQHEELMAQAEVKVRTMVDYITDLAMFAVACWLYLFKNELLAIPVLLVMAYRQLQAEVAKRIPKWLLRRLRRKKK
ncbi:hypothetical protein NQ318_016808 [Aromia moschata]|uniref:Titin n=1 Tax=Aromia moschata TaxID=1265417 RepID=A0AAV8YSC6_9CUCU|nr:hypothetical protein NQ318_016808 [Aromia moschata]